MNANARPAARHCAAPAASIPVSRAPARRVPGTGYGRSSGYADPVRSFAPGAMPSRFRVH